MKAAQPFMLTVVQIGSTKRDTLLLTPTLCSAFSIVTGRVAAELLVKRAISTAGIMARKVLRGLMPLHSRKMGSTMRNCVRLPPMITSTYFPNESNTMPPPISATSCAAKATIPIGSTAISQRISTKRSSCSPLSRLSRVCFGLLSGMRESAMPAAKHIISRASTLPSSNGRTTLSGMTDIR